MGRILAVDPLLTSPAWKLELQKKMNGTGNEIIYPESFEIDVLKHYLPETDAIVTVFSQVTREMISQATNLKVIVKPGAGIDNIDLKFATESRVMVCNVEGVRGQAVSEHVFLMILHIARHAWMRDAQEEWKHTLGVQLAKKKIGIVGLGNIGLHVAQIAKGFGMEIYVNTRTPDSSICKGIEIEFVSLETIFRISDFIVLSLPLVKETRGLICKETISLMKENCILVNVSRGEIVVTDDLYYGIKTGKIYGAGLDVTDPEPLPKNHPLWSLENVFISPHNSSRTPETQNLAIEKTCKNLTDALSGLMPLGLVNSEVFGEI